MAKRSNKVLQMQKYLFGFVGVVVVVVVGYALTTILAERPGGEFVEGTHYQLIEAPRRIRGNKTEVMEFFSYTCIHCFNFDPLLNDWKKSHAGDANVVRTPTVSGEAWRLFGQTYYTLQALDILEENHGRFFSEIHQRGRTFRSMEEIADWFDSQGATREQFVTTFTSNAVLRRTASADALGRQLKIAGIPSLVINGKYLVGINREVGARRMLEVADYLINMENKTSTPATE
ncbi:MAG: thiol:disulfide interchange protein DsbA [Candidatus Azotimanducaceae bacterium]|jgi:thiol:disulfide interchange protein DsbA